MAELVSSMHFINPRMMSDIKVVIGESESEILKMLGELPK